MVEPDQADDAASCHQHGRLCVQEALLAGAVVRHGAVLHHDGEAGVVSGAFLVDARAAGEDKSAPAVPQGKRCFDLTWSVEYMEYRYKDT